MPDIINPIIQFSVYIPGALLAYCPMKHHLRISSRKLALIGIPLLILLCIGCGSLCYILRIKTLWISTPLIIAFTAVYCSTINVSKWEINKRYSGNMRGFCLSGQHRKGNQFYAVRQQLCSLVLL